MLFKFVFSLYGIIGNIYLDFVIAFYTIVI